MADEVAECNWHWRRALKGGGRTRTTDSQHNSGYKSDKDPSLTARCVGYPMLGPRADRLPPQDAPEYRICVRLIG